MATPEPPAAWEDRILGYEPAVDPTQLLAHELNARRHPGAQRDALRESLGRVGWVDVVKVNQRTGKVVDGHARVEEAITAGVTVPVLYVDLEEEEERFVLATLDPISAMATYDHEIMGQLIDGLAIEAEGLSELLDGLTIDTDLPGDSPWDDRTLRTAEEPTRVAAGQRWQMGRHHLVCGSSTDPRSWEGCPDARLVVTDPPYGIAYSGGGGVEREPITNDGTPEAAVAALMGALETLPHTPGCAVYVFGPAAYLEIPNALAEAEIYRHQLIWAKNNATFGRSDYHYRHESIYYGWYPDGPHPPVKDRTRNSVIEWDRPTTSEDHPTTKPTGLYTHLITGHQLPKTTTVADPFAGSGTIIAAAEQANVTGWGIELDPRYVEGTLDRWDETHPDNPAELVSEWEPAT